MLYYIILYSSSNRAPRPKPSEACAPAAGEGVGDVALDSFRSSPSCLSSRRQLTFLFVIYCFIMCCGFMFFMFVFYCLFFVYMFCCLSPEDN